MSKWAEVYDEVALGIHSIRGIWFRGHTTAGWTLLPSLARVRPTHTAVRPYASAYKREQGTYHRFLTDAGSLLPPSDGWNITFAMQHHGIPTRLLDWTTTFGVALYFALKEATSDAAVWILNPHRLNDHMAGSSDVFDLEDVGADYSQMFIRKSHEPKADIVAFDPPRYQPRVFNQRSGFTLHANLEQPLEALAPHCVRKIVIPISAHEGAREFLRLAGISEFSLFPDLDGLAREIRARYF